MKRKGVKMFVVEYTGGKSWVAVVAYGNTDGIFLRLVIFDAKNLKHMWIEMR